MTAYLWFSVAAFALTAYIVLDGYDLGVGVLNLVDRDPARRKRAEELIATSWDANESWIILAAVSLFAGLPGAYAVLLPAFYVPVLVLLFAIIARGASFEMQSASPGYNVCWGTAVVAASVTAAFTQGVILGGLLSGVSVRAGAFAGSTFSFLTAYSVLTGVTVVVIYALAGAAWLYRKTDAEQQAHARRHARMLALAAATLTVASALTAPVAVRDHVTANPARATITILLLVLAVAAFASVELSLRRSGDLLPFLACVAAEVLAVAALGAAVLPTLIPPSITIRDAAASLGSLDFLLIGVGGAIPATLAYNVYAYRVFRGKFEPDEAQRAQAVSDLGAGAPAASVEASA